MAGTVLIGFGIFNAAEGVINHHLLGIHHVNETVARAHWIYWDIGFTLSGIIMLAAGWALMKQGERESVAAAARGSGQ